MRKFAKIFKIKERKFLFNVETSKNPSDYQKYEDLRNEIWADARDNLAGTRNMMCENFFNQGNSLITGVFGEDEEGCFKQDREHLIGFSYGVVGVQSKDIAFKDLDNLRFYSQYTGIREGFRHYGLGMLIKEFQRETLINIFGIYNVTCTYDPLTGINAYRNIHHFGMEVLEYREAYYGEFEGLLNRADIPCDRFYTSWDLKRKIQRPEYDIESLLESGYLVIEAITKAVKGKSVYVTLETIKELNLNLDSEFLLVEIPVDFYRMLQETDVSEDETRKIPLEWRMKTRQVFKNLFKRKYRIIDFRQIERDKRKRDFYILKK